MGLPSLPPQDHPTPSALQTLLNTNPPPHGTDPHLHNLALQISHNLRYQHAWTSLKIHQTCPLTGHRLPRPLISGLPPQRLYVHPDEQVELLQQQKRRGGVGLPVLQAEREWVIPSHLRERWSLRRFGEVFDGVGAVPGAGEGESIWRDDEDDGAVIEAENKWRLANPKRALLATLDDDSTVVYYIVHDGIVKPRQN